MEYFCSPSPLRGEGRGEAAAIARAATAKSPDCSWINFEKWNALTEEQKKNFAHVSPDFVIELMSPPSDNQKSARQKMEKWIENGVQMAWLIDPASKEVFIYRADGTINKVQGFENKLSGENILPGFELDLSIIK